MPIIYEIAGEQVEVDAPLTDAEIDEIASNIKATTYQEPSLVDTLGRQAGLAGRAIAKSALTGFGVAPILIDPFQNVAGVQTTSQAAENVLNRMGFPKPETTIEQAVGTGIEAATGIGGQAKGALAAAKGIRAGSTQSNVLLKVGEDLGQQLATGVPASMVADQIASVADDNNADPTATAVTSLAGGLFAGIVGGKAYRKATTPKIPLYTPEMARNEARVAYGKVKDAGIKIKPSFVDSMVSEIEANLKRTEGGYLPDAIKEHGQVKNVLDSFKTVAESGDVSFETLDKLRSVALTYSRESSDKSIKRLMGQVVEGVDLKIATLQPANLVSGTGESLGKSLVDVRTAREAWRRNAKATVLEDTLEEALRRGVSPTGREGEIIRKKFENLYANKKQMRLFSKEEQEAIKRVAEGGAGLESLLNFTARFNPQRGQLVTGGLLAGATQSPTVAATIAGAGILSDVALEKIQRTAAKNVLSQIASGKIQKPRTDVRWRALVEAEAKALQAQEERAQEPQVPR